MSRLRAKKLNVTLVVMLCLSMMPPLGMAEVIERRSMVSEVEQNRFEQALEERLTRDVKSYLNHEFFIIQANVQLENLEKWDVKEVLVPVEPAPAPPEAAPAENRKQPSPSVTAEEKPSEKEILSQMELETEDGIDEQMLEQTLGMDIALPGIPVSQAVFEEQKKQIAERKKVKEKPKAEEPKPEPKAPPEPPKPVMKKETVEKLISKTDVIRKLRLKVMLDDHVSPEQEVFIRNLVIEKGNLSFIRGDELNILRSSFPAASILDEEKNPEEAKAEEPPPEVAAEEPPVDEIPWWEKYWKYLVGLAIGIVMLILWLILRRREHEPVVVQTPVEESESSKKIDELIQKMHEKVDTVSINRLEAIREELVSFSVTDQDLVSEQVGEWLNSGSEEDANKSTMLYKLLGEGLYRGLAKNALTPEKQVAIAAKLMEMEDRMTADERLELGETVFQALMQRRYQQQHDLQNEVKPFFFLEKLNDDQILYLLKEEALKVKALVMSQLSSQRGASLLKRFNSANRSKIAMEISEFAKLPISAFRDIANRLAKKAVHVPSYENLEVDGIDLLTDMLDHMNAAEETALLASLKRDNPDLYYAIKQVYVGFDDIVQIPAMGLKNLIREIERDVLALSLFDTDEKFRTVIYEAMLERPRAMLESTIKNLQNPEANAVDDAKRKVSRQARAMLKSGTFTMPVEKEPPKPQKKTA
ncbi:MAG: hypothetical protein OEX19_00940 [Gammaproteobacteria bacterium]|nr:hypothetical protein [Gammaproteobacteria bacterium]